MTPEQAYTYAAALCNKAEYCTAEIAAKLRTKGLDAADIANVLSTLHAQRLGADRRYAMAFARQKFRNQLWGRRKIEIELRRKRIPSDIIAEATAQIGEREYTAALRSIIAKKARSYPAPPDRAARTSIARFAIARGFEPSLVFHAIASTTHS